MDAATERSKHALSRSGTRFRRVCACTGRCRRCLRHAPALCRRSGWARQLAGGRGDATGRKPRRPDPHAVVSWRAGDRRDARPRPRRRACCRGWRADVAGLGHCERAQASATAQRGTATRSWRCSSARETNSGSRERARSRCTLQVRWSTAGRTMGAAATRSGRATSAQPSTSPTASMVEGSYPSPRTIIRRVFL